MNANLQEKHPRIARLRTSGSSIRKPEVEETSEIEEMETEEEVKSEARKLLEDFITSTN